MYHQTYIHGNPNVIVLVLLAFAAIATVLTTTGARGSRAYAVVSVLPLLITVGLPQLAFDRALIIAITRLGIGLSFLLLAVGVALMLRAIRSGDRIAALWLGAETVVASFPALVFTLYYVVFYLLQR